MLDVAAAVVGTFAEEASKIAACGRQEELC
ncbi:hypothetical protein ABID16_000335 [Rhizobium aquaticum]|uniref:Uncharacterized protein n=1 Tax=Rhizobium aquaticum TaxID=1549636 RepID=A0ABV2IU70_9HYPH